MMRRGRAWGISDLLALVFLYILIREAWHLIVTHLLMTACIATILIGLIVNMSANRKRRRIAAERARVEAIARSGIESIDVMDGQSFERRMAIHFQLLGWHVHETPASHDYGADLILLPPDGRKIVVQLKRYNGPVPIDAVQQVIAAIPYYKATTGMVITNSSLTQNARNLAKAAGIEVWEREELIRQLLSMRNDIESGSRQFTVS